MTEDGKMNSFEIQYLATQYGLLIATIGFYAKLIATEVGRDRNSENEQIKAWCKAVIRNAGNAGGMLQTAGQRMRRRYPEEVNLILIAFDELLVEEPSLRLPSLAQFLNLMDGVERGSWPHAALAMSGKVPVYRKEWSLWS